MKGTSPAAWFETALKRLLTMRVARPGFPRGGKSRPFRACLYKPCPPVYIAGQRAECAPARSTFLRKWEEIIHETRLYPANDDLQPQSGRRTQRSQDVGRRPSAVRARQEIHPRDRRSHVGRVRKARREEDR